MGNGTRQKTVIFTADIFAVYTNLLHRTHLLGPQLRSYCLNLFTVIGTFHAWIGNLRSLISAIFYVGLFSIFLHHFKGLAWYLLSLLHRTFFNLLVEVGLPIMRFPKESLVGENSTNSETKLTKLYAVSWNKIQYSKLK